MKRIFRASTTTAVESPRGPSNYTVAIGFVVYMAALPVALLVSCLLPLAA